MHTDRPSNHRPVRADGRAAARTLAAAAVIALFLSLPPAPVLAADPASPTTLTFISTRAYRHVYETDDLFIIFNYNIYYSSSQPTTPATELFHFRLMNTNGTTQIGATVPYAYNNSGYDEGIGAFYYSAADAPTWGLAYVLRLEGNPQYWATPPVATHTISSSEYSTGSTQAANRSLLGNYILSTAARLEVNWGVKLVTEGDKGTVLNTTGETYFKGSISGLKTICPGIFSVIVTPGEWPTDTGSTTPVATGTPWYEGTFVGDGFDSIESLLHVAWKLVVGGVLFGVIILCMTFTQVSWGTTDPGYLVGGIVFTIGAFAEVVDWTIVGVVALLSLLYVGFNIWWKQG